MKQNDFERLMYSVFGSVFDYKEGTNTQKEQ